jgi:hypothetical protein
MNLVTVSATFAFIDDQTIEELIKPLLFLSNLRQDHNQQKQKLSSLLAIFL